ncbi:arabinose-5-phosphate isomerase [Chitinophaga terrae (ex Kim and Jung 2007)]|uniref:Arabinose-5-phosphate isomerase n=1 Tax=Chitinophaga terrae (ex Kim and Jung 2007) TaxID=408074 RepID=A0A1H4EAM8_9BACT|nr:KpsF/GutQ family sugar-phosphate isomerase [Chitinophaga terrae (ex Kim and Jung 2007)]GEP91507.1 D-arabinose 5-phosphate isomerase [Chitinophaga terrae (ex Kim and Jung 2007)]SEA81996.1 arabinose-5-phosphate isomerase [Chitinophaga terrae (ex Kim and Jung 2007)]
MKRNESINIGQIARRTIAMEATAISDLQQFINADFEQVVELIAHCKGRVVVTGIGKSAIIAQKIVATFNSTGTPALFMHAAEAIHGDLGMITEEDVVLCISKSGSSAEIKVLVPLVKNFGNKLVAMVGNTDSFLAREADYVLNTTVSQEACPNNLAPTTSTTAQLAMGDALAVCLIEYHGFTAADFAKFHPGGALGKKLYLKVADLSKLHQAPQVTLTSSLREVIVEISSKMLGVTAVLNEEGLLQGIITDGDLRRMLEKNVPTANVQAKDIMSLNPKVIQQDELAINALDMMRQHDITQLLVMDGNRYQGIIHLHDLIREGII